MRIIDSFGHLHKECYTPFIRFFMNGDKSDYVLMANEYHGCYKDEYIIKVFNTPESAWDACQLLKRLLLELPVESDKVALRWCDEVGFFDWEFLQHDSK